MSDIAGPESPDIFADVYEPTEHLKVPADPKSIPNPKGPLALLDAISPATWVNEFLKAICDYDPLEEFTKHFAGDWTAYAKCGEAYRRIGECINDAGGNIRHGSEKLAAVWEGNASERAQEYFGSTGKILGNKDKELAEVEDQYDLAARSVWSSAEAASDIIKTIFDLAAIAAVSALAGAATSWSGGGAVVGYGVAALSVVEIVEEIDALTKTFNAASTTVHAISALIEGMVADSGEVKLTPLPDVPYHHPAV